METLVLILNDGENNEKKLFQFNIGWKVRFILGPSLFGKKISLYSNIPSDNTQVFCRDSYRLMEWKSDSVDGGDDTSSYVEIMFSMSGSFHYFITAEGLDHRCGSGYLLVRPNLKVGLEQKQLSLDSIQCQTVLSKLLGPINEWEQRLEVAKKAGYNMVHFTPIQTLGGSNSAYSLKDQHNLNVSFSTKAKTCSYDDIRGILDKVNDDWQMLCVTDVVLNHTSNDSPWLQLHPDSAYNLCNSPHLRPAYLLDRVLFHFSEEVADNKWTGKGLSSSITDEKDLNVIRDTLHNYFLPNAKIHEFYTVDLDKCVEDFKVALQDYTLKENHESQDEIEVIQDSKFRRNASLVDIDVALNNITNKRKTYDGITEEYIANCCVDFRYCLHKLNTAIIAEINHHLSAAVENVISSVRYERLQADGPKLKVVSQKYPLVPPYFHCSVSSKSIKEEEAIIWSDESQLIMAHNGWVMNDDPLRNFIDEGCNVFLRRELIAWGDSVKLRYGKSPKDSPFLWQHMQRYVEDTARLFYGIRLDNCHSTPIEVAEHLLDAARKIRPNLYVFAELFTSNEETDNIFVNRLGINSLIRESMSTHDSHELGRLVHRYGGEPVGSFSKPFTRPATPSIAHALFLDQTHDNPSPIEKRSVYDLLPNSALISMACCASGSNRGYDELIPYHIHVVNESRLYTSWSDDKSSTSIVNYKIGIIKAKLALNELHSYLGRSGFSEVYVDQVNSDVVAVTRHCPASHVSVILVAHTAFSKSYNVDAQTAPLCIPGKIDEILIEASLVKTGETSDESVEYIVGLSHYSLEMNQNLQLAESKMIRPQVDPTSGNTEIQFVNFPPGSIIAFKVSMQKSSIDATNAIKSSIQEMGVANSEFNVIVSKLSLCNLNHVLFRCDAEEKDDGNGFGVYNVPNYGDLPYCGLQGMMDVLKNIRSHNDLGHPLCENLRQGNWLPEYIYKRLLVHESTKPLGAWFQGVFTHLNEVPRYLIPRYFDGIIVSAYSALIDQIWAKMSSFVSNGSAFVKSLAMASVQLAGIVESSPLPELSPNLPPPLPPTWFNPKTQREQQKCATLSAGLPHFSVGYMRNWGRDTFISLRGLFLLTGRFEEARYIILAFGACLRHGLIPNLLNQGTQARFNCRDAIWWWLQTIQDYVDIVPNGHKILKDPVSRLFPTDDSEPQESGKHDQPLHDVVQETLQRHFEGVKYRERNAGTSLDVEMSIEGFDNEIGVDPSTGFVFGGSGSNCGTWMDKMGRSKFSGTKGKPATPRDGSAVEIVGLCKSAIRWLLKMHKSGHYPYNSVTKTTASGPMELTFADWDAKIQKSFEKHFWVDVDKDPKPELVHRNRIYKDTYNSSQFWADYQLRPNFAIAMVVAPELFQPERAWAVLKTAEEVLLGPLGMKTLDPADWAYHGNYNNSDSSSDVKTAGGYNYHQGPEWLWPIGYFLRAKLIFSSMVGNPELRRKTKDKIKSFVAKHYETLNKSAWHGLPELTNENGEHCPDSCLIQAWSHSSLLEVLYELQNV